MWIIWPCAGVCRPYSVCPRQQCTLTLSGRAVGVAQCDNKLFVVTLDSDTIQIFERDNKQQTNITVNGLKEPTDIVACTETKQLYIADCESDCVWGVSLDGQHVDKLTNRSTSPKDWRPYSLSLTSRRLLATSKLVNNSLFKHRVLLLNSRLELERVLLDIEHHQLVKSPWRLCYVEQTSQLIVASELMSSPVIQVYRIRESS